jgi:hypothetical protein
MTIVSPNSLDTTLIQDGQPAGSITPAIFRTVVNSLAGIAASTQTASYTAASTDAGTVVEMNSASALNFTVPPNSSVAYDIGTVIMIFQLGAGQVTLVAGAGVTLDTPSSLTTRVQYSTASVRKRATNEWVVAGDIT